MEARCPPLTTITPDKQFVLMRMPIQYLKGLASRSTPLVALGSMRWASAEWMRHAEGATSCPTWTNDLPDLPVWGSRDRAVEVGIQKFCSPARKEGLVCHPGSKTYHNWFSWSIHSHDVATRLSKSPTFTPPAKCSATGLQKQAAGNPLSYSDTSHCGKNTTGCLL